MTKGHKRPELYEWYWINAKEIEGETGKPFGKILKIINPEVIVICLCTLNQYPKIIKNPYIIARYLIGEKMSAEEETNVAFPLLI